MKTSELIQALTERLAKHGDVEVEVTFESTRNEIENDGIYMSKFGSLLIDVDGNFYKPDFAVDPTEGE